MTYIEEVINRTRRLKRLVELDAQRYRRNEKRNAPRGQLDGSNWIMERKKGNFW